MTGVWVAVVLETIGNSSMFVSLMGLCENYFHVTGRVTSYFLLSICVGDILVPWFVGQFVESCPEVFNWTLVGCGMIVGVVYLTLLMVLRRYK